jgi:phosphatidylinositol alpha-1,6-mannosyltransferase
LITEWFLPHVGGSVNLFLNALSAYPRGEAHVLTGEPLEGVGAEGPSSPLPTTRVSLQRYEFLRPESLALYSRMTRAALGLARSFRPDLVHCGHVFPEAPVAWVLQRLFGIPYLVYVHGEEVAIQRHYKWKRRLMPRFYSAAAAVVANSSNSKQLVVELGVDPEKVHVVHPGVDLDRFQPGPREPDGEIRLLSVGRLWPRKGHMQVLRALARVKDRLPRLRYWIAGTGGELDALQRASVEFGLEDRVRFLGYVPETELPLLYRQCDLLILANRRLADDDMEGFGIVFLEAAASGLPVIGGNSGGVPDAIDPEGNGFLVDTEDPDAIAGGLERLVLDGALRGRMSTRSREWAERFAWSRYADELATISEQCVRSRGSA